MLEKKQKSFFRRFFASRLFLFACVACIVFIVFANIRIYYNGYKIKKEIETMQREIEGLNKKKLESMEILKYVMSQNYAEDTARTELNMKKPGEHVLIFQKPASSSIQNIQTTGSGQPVGNALKWWYYFSGKELPKE